MFDYRLFHLRDGKIIGTEEFRADSDEAAVVHASELRGGGAAELWHGLRKIWTFEGHPGPDIGTS